MGDDVRGRARALFGLCPDCDVENETCDTCDQSQLCSPSEDDVYRALVAERRRGVESGFSIGIRTACAFLRGNGHDRLADSVACQAPLSAAAPPPAVPPRVVCVECKSPVTEPLSTMGLCRACSPQSFRAATQPVVPPATDVLGPEDSARIAEILTAEAPAVPPGDRARRCGHVSIAEAGGYVMANTCDRRAGHDGAHMQGGVSWGGTAVAAPGAGDVSQCRGCGATLLRANQAIPDGGYVAVADGCPCNSARGVNHGLVPAHVCTCVECDPRQTGSARAPHAPGAGEG